LRTELRLSKENVGKFMMPVGGNERILLVDDEQMLADVWKELLEHLGYQVMAQTSSLEALRVFREEPGNFDLIITDHKMPDMVGLDLARELRAIRADIPIILSTGSIFLIDHHEAERVGIQSILLKPFDLQSMAKTVRMALESNERTE